ncbi:MAG: VPLPA-CTERM-specific exosortase XrtD, partial [Pseudomonadales bacterium]|nr:VPLPA-CTERM-specific exosortase XrtD [Pseudomonadales bacterium]
QTYTIVHYAFLVALCGLVWAVMGRAAKLVLIPISLLLFTIPLPVFTQATLTADLQLLSSRMGTALIQALGVPVYLEGNIIDLGVYRLHVAEACAGLNYLFPLLGIGHLCAYLFRSAAWKRILLVVSTVPLTVLMNVVRIACVGLLVREFGTGAAEGFIHFFQGWLVFLVSTVILLAEMALLNRVGSVRVDLREMFDLRAPASATAADARDTDVLPPRVTGPLLACILMIFAALGLTLVQERRPDVLPERVDFALFPAFLGDWVGRRSALEPEVARALGADDYLAMSYRRAEEVAPVELFAAYYGAQRRGRRPHSPQVCLPGGGWEIERIERADALASGLSLPHNRVVMRKGDDRLLAYYWFEQRGRVFANEYLMRWNLFAGGVFEQRRDGAMVRVLTLLRRGERVADAEGRLEDLLLLALPRLPSHLPD